MRLWSLRNILLQCYFRKNFLWRKPLSNIFDIFIFSFVLIFFIRWALRLLLAYLNTTSFLRSFLLIFFSQIYWKTFCSWYVLRLINICGRGYISWFIQNFRQWFCTWSRFWPIWFASWFIPKVRFWYIT